MVLRHEEEIGREAGQKCSNEFHVASNAGPLVLGQETLD